MNTHRVIGLALAATWFVAGCGGSSGQASDPSQAASQRLAGDWHLLSFQASLALEEPLKGLLEAQFKTLTVSFQNGQFTATGPSVDTGGRYEIISASGDSFNGRVYDRAGAGYGISGQFAGSQLQFTSTDAPWVGTGVLERVR
jgi:hypothetical protein